MLQRVPSKPLPRWGRCVTLPSRFAVPRCPTPQGWHLPFVTAASCRGARGVLVPVCFRNSARMPSPREPLGEESGLAPAGLRGEQGRSSLSLGGGKTSQQTLASPSSYLPAVPTPTGAAPTLATRGALSCFNPLLGASRDPRWYPQQSVVLMASPSATQLAQEGWGWCPLSAGLAPSLSNGGDQSSRGGVPVPTVPRSVPHFAIVV